MNAELVVRQLSEIYGPQKGQSIYLAVMPGVLADFRKMLGTARSEEKISEEYYLDDGRAFLAVSGSRRRDGSLDIDVQVAKK